MKYITVFLGIISFGFSSSRIDPLTLHFKAGDKVSINSPFYWNCSGIVTDYIRYKEPGEFNRYTIELKCPGMSSSNEAIIPEPLLEKL